MRSYSVACRAAEQKMAELFTGELRARERLELEAHADGCARCDTALRDLSTISVALDRAYAPLRQRGTQLSAARVRLATRIETQPSLPWWRIGFVGRLSEATMALGFAALVIGGSLDVPVKPDAPLSPASASAPSIIKDYMRTQPPYEETTYLRWLRLQPRLIVSISVPVVRYPAGGRFDLEPLTTVDDWLRPGAAR